jgi:diaminopimelate decarboxylase
MDFFYRNSELGFLSGEVFFSLNDIASRAKRPVYVYHLDSILQRYQRFVEAFQGDVLVCYAVKANSHPVLLRALAQKGAGADVVSGGEIKLALSCGFPGSRMVFSGVGKEKYEIQLALENRIKQINVESPSELRRIGKVARALGLQANVAFRLNPDVNPDTHPYIRTGFRENKFGMDESFVSELKKILNEYSRELKLVGLSLHIGSQIRDLGPIEEAVRKSLPLFKSLRESGHPLNGFDVGGGLGIDYHQDNESSEIENVKLYAQAMRDLLKPLGCEVLCEPGRILVAGAGVLLTEVQYIKETPYKRFAIVNTGMHHLLRPALYEAYHRILPLKEGRVPKEGIKTYDVVGPICESADVIGFERELPELAEGDYLAIMDTGAYGAVMASHYNSHELPLEWVYHNGEELH